MYGGIDKCSFATVRDGRAVSLRVWRHLRPAAVHAGPKRVTSGLARRRLSMAIVLRTSAALVFLGACVPDAALHVGDDAGGTSDAAPCVPDDDCTPRGECGKMTIACPSGAAECK